MEDNRFAIIVEGGAERVIVNTLLDNDLLIFNRSEMLEEDMISDRSGRKFATNHLNFDFNFKIDVFRVLDSHNEKFTIPIAYQYKISSVTNLYTSPEIEILIIINQGDFDRFKNSNSNNHAKKLSASQWCKQMYKMNSVKAPEFILDYWGKFPDKLVKSIILYAEKCNDPFRNTLASILKPLS